MTRRLLALACLSGGALWAEEPLVIRWAANNSAIEVVGLSAAEITAARLADWTPARWAEAFYVRVESGDIQKEWDLPAVLGEHSIEGTDLRFTPKFPPSPGVRYRVAFRPETLPRGGDPIATSLEIPPQDMSPTTVLSQIYPSGDVVPENLLKFYLHFSAPMSAGHIYDHIHLRDEAGQDVELPFLEIDEELWDPAMKRLTLFIDPGRIKREVKPLEDIGPALVAGAKYTLVINAAWTDARGAPLRETFTKHFVVGPPDREPLNPAKWKLAIPRAGTREPIQITFPEPMDEALTRRVIALVDSAKRSVGGEVALEANETRWAFTPREAWRRGSYQVIAGASLEDLAGNNVGKAFEVDIFETARSPRESKPTEIPWEIR